MTKGSANAEAKLVASLAAGKAKIQSLIKGDAADPKMATSEDARAGLYAGVLRMYEGLAPGLAGTLGEAYEATAEQAARQAAKQLGEDALQVKFSKARLDNVLQIIHSGSVSDFCAVLTHKMGEQVVTALRAAVLEVLRRQAVEGLSAADTNKELQAAWARVANDANTYKFVDRGGRIWDNARYFQMLVRTNSWRIWREIYLDTIAQLGEDLVRISADSGPEQCKVCKAWEGRILTISGKDKRFPSYQDARAAGVFHPNCTHRLVAVLEGLSDDDLEAQAAENQARVDAGGSIGPTPPKPPKPGDYVPPKGHKKPKPAAPAGPTPEELAKKKADEEAAARKKAEEEAKKAREDAKARLQKLQERAVKATSAFEAIKATAAAAAVSAANAALAVKDFGAIAWTAACDLPDPQYKDGRTAAVAAKKDAEDAAKQADIALAGVKPERNALLDALGDADADKPETVEAFAKALDAYEAKTGTLLDTVEEAARAAKTAEETAAKALADFRAVFDPLDKAAKAEKAAIEPKVKALVADASKGHADLKTALRDGSTGSTDAKRTVAEFEKRRDDLVDEVANASAVSKTIWTSWESDLKTVDGQIQAMDAERRAFDAAGSRVSKALNAAKKAVADAEAKWQAGDGKGALAALLKAEGHAGTMDANFNDASFQQYQGHVASYGPKVQAVQADLARVRALVQNAAAVQPPSPASLKAGTIRPDALPDVSMPTSMAGLTVGKSLGGHSGADARLATDANGKMFVVKESGGVSKDCLKNEAAMDAFYRAAGVNVPAVATFEEGGRQVKVSEFVAGGTEIGTWWKHATAQQRADMKKRLEDGFAADVLLANWDVAGTSGDNILVDATGVPWRIDNGGAGAFRATGKPKTADEWTNGAAKGWLHELFSMPESSLNKTYFGGIKPADVCRRIAETDWTDALQKLDPATRAVVEDRIAKCQELAALEVLESDGLTEQGMPLFIEGCRNYGPGAYKKSRVDAATWFSTRDYKDPVAACNRKFLADQTSRFSFLPPRERAAAEDYTGSHYRDMNAFFRTGLTKDRGRAESLARTIEKEPDRGDIWLQRGNGDVGTISLAVANMPSDISKLVGMEWTDKGFMSCTPIKGKGFGTEVILNLYCPNGAKMIYAEAFSHFKGGREREMILQAGSRFVITKAEETNGTTFLDLALIGQTTHSP